MPSTNETLFIHIAKAEPKAMVTTKSKAFVLVNVPYPYILNRKTIVASAITVTTTILRTASQLSKNIYSIKSRFTPFQF